MTLLAVNKITMETVSLDDVRVFRAKKGLRTYSSVLMLFLDNIDAFDNGGPGVVDAV